MRSHDSCTPALKSCVPAQVGHEVAEGAVGLVAVVGIDRLDLGGVDAREAHGVADGDAGGALLIAARELAPHAAEARVEDAALPHDLIELRHVVLRRLVLQRRGHVFHEQVGRVAAVEAVLEVAVEHERGARGGRHLRGDLAHVVLDAVVVDGLRSVGVHGPDLELVQPPAAGRAEEPQAVALERAAERRAPVVGHVDGVAGRAGLAAGGEAEAGPQVVVDVRALQLVVHEVEVVIAGEAIAARLGHHVHVNARDIAFGGARSRLHVVFLVHLEAVVLHRRAAAAPRPVGLQAVDREGLLAVGRTEGLEVVTAACPRCRRRRAGR